MEFDSIIYIVIAIVLAIVNAIAQKKKKAAQSQGPVASDEAYESIEGEEDAAAYPQAARAEESLDPFELLFGGGEQPKVPEPQEQEVLQAEPELIMQEPEPNSHQQKMQEVAQKLLEEEDVEIGAYDQEENVIAKSAIGDVLSLEEENFAQRQARNVFAREFDARKAIIYSEIIRPKYFAAGVIS